MNEAVALAVARLFDESAAREPSHTVITELVARSGLAAGDPRTSGASVGKGKRVRAILRWAIEHDAKAGARYLATLIDTLRVYGAFRADSPNRCSPEAFRDAAAAFAMEGFVLSPDGELRPGALDSMDGRSAAEALRGYVRRIRQGQGDAALMVGSSKDLLEATVRHVLLRRFGSDQPVQPFPVLLGQAFAALDLTTPTQAAMAREPIARALQRSFFELGLQVNRLRNKAGTGHGRAFVVDVDLGTARAAAEAAALVSALLLDRADELGL